MIRRIVSKDLHPVVVTQDGEVLPSSAVKLISPMTALQEAFSHLGGTERLVAWGNTNYPQFLGLWARTIPIEAKLTHDVPEGVKVELSWLDPSKRMANRNK